MSISLSSTPSLRRPGREEWELNSAMGRLLPTRNIRGSKPKWRWTKKKNGKMVRDSKGGIG